MVSSALWWAQPPNEFTSGGWRGPVQCIAMSSRRVFSREKACGKRDDDGTLLGFPVLFHGQRLVATRRLVDQGWRNCTICESQVACGATEGHPNLVDGTLRVLPANTSSQSCMLAGQSFSGYHSTRDASHVTVQLAATVEEALYSDELREVLAPFVLGAGSLAVLGSVAWLLYTCARTGCHDERPDMGYGECWGPSPTWRSQYAMVKGGLSSKEGDDVCCVCLSARCGEVQFMDCGHAVVCLTCASLLQHCPMCSEPIESIRIDPNVLL